MNVIKHYNSGWANGYHYNIKYWEIWNEPDGRRDFWTGTPEQYYKLYEITAKAIKNYDPNVKVGGPAMARAAYHSWKDSWSTARITRFL